MVDVEGEALLLIRRNIIAAPGPHQLQRAAVLHGVADLGIAHAQLLHQVLEVLLVLVADLDDHAGVLGEEDLHQVTAFVI